MSQHQPSPVKADAIEQARARAQRLANAFADVFGQPKKRNETQQLVIEHLSVCAGDDANSYRFNEAKDGLALIAAGIHRDGARSLLRIIDRQLSIAANVREPRKPKPATTR